MGIRIGLGLSPVLGAGGAFTPRNLNPYAWYDVHLGGSSTQITDSSANGRAAATFGATSAAPLYLPYTTPAVYFPGVSGNYVWCADSAALSFDDDIEVVMRVKAPNWATGAGQTLVGQYVTSTNDRRFRFYVSGTGDVGLSASEDGTSGTVRTATITPSTPLAADTWQWHRMRFQRSNGSNCVGTLDTAADTGSNSILPLSFTANGTGTGTACSGIANTSAPLELGSFTNGTLERFTGQIGRMIYKSGIDGTTVADFNADLCGQTGYTDAYSNVWTAARSTSGYKLAVQSVQAGSSRGLCLFSGDTMEPPSAAFPPMASSGQWETVMVVRQFVTAVSFGYYLSTRAASGTVAGIAMASNGTSSATVYATTSDGSTNPTYGSPTSDQIIRKVISLRRTSATVGYLNVNGTDGTAANLTGVGDTTGTRFYIGSRAGSSQFQDFEFEAFLTFARVLTTAERAALTAYYGG